MKIEVGKRYKMRNGDVTGPMLRDHMVDGVVFETLELVGNLFGMWDSEGRAGFFGGTDDEKNRQYDIVESAHVANDGDAA